MLRDSRSRRDKPVRGHLLAVPSPVSGPQLPRAGIAAASRVGTGPWRHAPVPHANTRPSAARQRDRRRSTHSNSARRARLPGSAPTAGAWLYATEARRCASRFSGFRDLGLVAHSILAQCSRGTNISVCVARKLSCLDEGVLPRHCARAPAPPRLTALRATRRQCSAPLRRHLKKAPPKRSPTQAQMQFHMERLLAPTSRLARAAWCSSSGGRRVGEFSRPGS